ncbi:tetratricopeptide (TPR) repeat protein [Pedobacter sp. UYEF25]
MMFKATFIFILLFSSTAFAQSDEKAFAQRDSLAVKDFFFAGLREKLMENDEAAALNFNKVLAIDKSNDAAFYELAKINFRINHLVEANQDAISAVNLKPKNKYYLQLLAEIYKAANNMSQLDNVLNKLIALDPQNSAYYFEKANVLLLTNKEEEAKVIYKIIEQKFGLSAALSASRKRMEQDHAKPGDMVRLLDSNNASAKDYLYAAELLMEKGNNNEALMVLEKAAPIDPDNFQILLALADAYCKMGKTSESFEALKSAFEQQEMPLGEKVQIIGRLFSKLSNPQDLKNVTVLTEILARQNPTDSKALALQADALFKQEKFVEALKKYEESLKINNQEFNVWEGLINTHNLIGQYAEAIKVCNEALTIYPNQASIYYFLAYSQYRTETLNEALTNVENALSLASEDHSLLAQIYALKADILINKNKYEDAKDAFHQAMKEEPDNYQLMTKAAYFLALREEDLAVAQGYAETAAKARPKNAAILDTYAFVLFKQKKYALAKQFIESAIQNKKTNDGVYLEHYGDILYFLGEYENALIKWKLAKEAGNTSKILIKKINEKKYFR